MQLIDCGTAPGHLINVIIIIKMFTEKIENKTKNLETPRFLGTTAQLSLKLSPERVARRYWQTEELRRKVL